MLLYQSSLVNSRILKEANFFQEIMRYAILPLINSQEREIAYDHAYLWLLKIMMGSMISNGYEEQNASDIAAFLKITMPNIQNQLNYKDTTSTGATQAVSRYAPSVESRFKLSDIKLKYLESIVILTNLLIRYNRRR